MKNYLELLRYLPKTNCQACGLESCLLFALKVFSGEIPIEKCPYLSEEIQVKVSPQKRLSFNQLLENLKYLKEKFSSLNVVNSVESLGLKLKEKDFLIEIPYLDLFVAINFSPEGYPLSLRELRGEGLDPRDEILICNYFIFKGKDRLTFDFVGLETFPHSLSKVKTLQKYAEEPLAKLFYEIKEAPLDYLKAFRISGFRKESSNFEFIIWILPKVPLRVVFWEGDEEEGLPPSCKVLYDSSALSYLDLECLVFCAERFAERLKLYLET